MLQMVNGRQAELHPLLEVAMHFLEGNGVLSQYVLHHVWDAKEILQSGKVSERCRRSRIGRARVLRGEPERDEVITGTGPRPLEVEPSRPLIASSRNSSIIDCKDLTPSRPCDPRRSPCAIRRERSLRLMLGWSILAARTNVLRGLERDNALYGSASAELRFNVQRAAKSVCSVLHVAQAHPF